MNLYRIWQTVNNEYDTYDSAIVAAESIEEARLIHPYYEYSMSLREWDGSEFVSGTWCAAKDVQVELIGGATPGTKKGVVLASFNAG